MKKHISFPSIEQYRNVVKKVRDRATYHSTSLPVLKFHGSVKLHGTNAGVVQSLRTGEIWAQSREQLISVDQDNAGFAKFVEVNRGQLEGLLTVARVVVGAHLLTEEHYVAIYGEWCGQGILKGCAVHQLPKMFVVFGIAVTALKPSEDGNDEQDRIWLTPDQVNDVFTGWYGATEDGKLTYVDNPNVGIYSIFMFPTWEVTVDFTRPEETQNELVAITRAVEQECPFGKTFGVSGVGEGVVWKCYDTWSARLGDASFPVTIKTSDLVFKVKGEKHSESKVKTTAEVDIEKVRSINEFVEKVVTDHRLEKAVEKLKEQGHEVDVKKTGEFLKIVGQDVLKEEGDTLDASGLERKDVMPAVSRHARQWWMNYLATSAVA